MEVAVDQHQDQHQDQGPGQVHESVILEMESGVINVGNMTHFASDCPNSITNEELDQYNSDNQSVLQILAHDNLGRSSSDKAIDHSTL